MQRRLITSTTAPFLRYTSQQPLLSTLPPPSPHYPTSATRSTLPLPASPIFSFPNNARSFQTSSYQLAQEAPSSPFGAEYDRDGVEGGELFSRLQAHPEALQAIEDMTKLTKEKTGVDLNGGQKPTMSMMLKLAHDPELRQCAERLMNALRTAGINIDPKAAFEALKVMGGDGFQGLNTDEALDELMMKKGKKGEGEDGEK